MPLLRVKTLFPLVAILSIGFFFWIVDRYDRAALSNLKKPIEQLQNTASAAVSSPNTNTNNNNNININNQKPAIQQLPTQSFGTCEFDPASAPPLAFSEWLQRKNFTRSYIRPHHVSGQTEFRTLEEIKSPVLPPFHSLERGLVSSENQGGLPCPPVIDVDVAIDHDVEETSKMLFGLATTVDRLERLLPSLLYSFGDSKAGVLVLVPESDDDLTKQEAYFRSRGLDVTLEASPLEFTARYFGLVEAFTVHIQSKRPQTTWVSFIDDDTFFPSVASVAAHLKELDATQKYYIGALSEASWQVDTWGHMAFGGAGVFVSKPLLEDLMANYDECQSWGEQPGDQKLGQCIERFGHSSLTTWPSLYQMDLTGAPDGVFESGRRIDTLHHWSSWYTKDVVKMSAVAAAAGKRSVLRRWIFDQQTSIDTTTGQSVRTFWVLTNGYSIVKYTLASNAPENAINFDECEKTWEEDISGYIQSLGPLRPKEQEGVTKERWLLSDAVAVGDNIHQLYSREEDESHSLIELVWLGPKSSGGAGVSNPPEAH
ncbi:hypothetical protein BGW36DRAFT_360761 [Talaromyces proteolyticus]|uniref:Glycosyltransferase family 31 protein n=1 Tax=Talaromyces proteolyticus TaxID=1131652 RepID=A0AAD4KQU8_9EURO|nr:uncharacterized protein BGW36DRAFT_360761 [Talaromyces proteolyticus]KAH8695046.1 hypothetical protein BGW36DRAFT_360761 [Talaromyces proteolyticus]